MSRPDVLFVLSTTLDVLGVLAVARLRSPVLAILLVLLWPVKLLVLGLLGANIFWGTIHVLWLDAIIVVPLAGLLLALRAPWVPARVVGAVALLAAPVGAYASVVEPLRLTETRVDVPVAAERDGARPLRLAVLADLQFEHVSDHEREAVERVVALRPDVILLPGDIHQGSAATLRDELPAIRRLLSRLRAPGGAWFVPGDQEDGPEAELVTAGTGVRLLRDEVVRVRAAGRRLTIGGIALDWRSGGAAATMRTLERSRDDGDVRILLAHRPDAVLELSRQSRVDLVVAGHTHGGQLQLPLLGPLFTATAVPRDVAGGGLHELGGRRIFVSRGVGVERGQAPRLRFLAPPEVALLTLRG